MFLQRASYTPPIGGFGLREKIIHLQAKIQGRRDVVTVQTWCGEFGEARRRAEKCWRPGRSCGIREQWKQDWTWRSGKPPYRVRGRLCWRLSRNSRGSSPGNRARLPNCASGSKAWRPGCPAAAWGPGCRGINLPPGARSRRSRRRSRERSVSRALPGRGWNPPGGWSTPRSPAPDAIPP